MITMNELEGLRKIHITLPGTHVPEVAGKKVILFSKSTPTLHILLYITQDPPSDKVVDLKMSFLSLSMHDTHEMLESEIESAALRLFNE